MKKCIVTILTAFNLLLSQHVVNAQELRNQEINFLINLTLFQEARGDNGYISNYKVLGDFLKLKYEKDTLKSEGFADFIFISISPILKYSPNNLAENGAFLLDNCKELIVALHKRGKTIYRLKGFRENDFPNFLTSLKSLRYTNVGSSKKLAKNYSVEKLDLGCLYEAFETYSINKLKYPCLISCSDMVEVH